MARLAILVLLSATALGGAANAASRALDADSPANVSVVEVKKALAAAKPGSPADFAGKSLQNLDLSGLNFSGANLANANLFGAKLADTNFSHADLHGANLDLSWLVHADFSDANLKDASLVAPVVAEGIDARAGEVPVFKGADLSGARVKARLKGGNLAGAKFAGADLSSRHADASFGLLHMEMGGAKLRGADFAHAKMGGADLSYADLESANFTGADLRGTVLTGADASGADFTDADLAGADVENVILKGAKGLDTARGLDQAKGYRPKAD